MRSLLVALCMTVATSSAFAQDEEFSCKTTDGLKYSKLECVSCGVQQYYQKKYGKEVAPSERWLAVLGTVVSSKYDTKGNPKKNETSEKIYQKLVIAKIHAYGFCTQYAGKKLDKDERTSADKALMLNTEWKIYWDKMEGRPVDEKNKDLKDLAKRSGFNSPDEMLTLIKGGDEGFGKTNGERRPKFQSRLHDILNGDRSIDKGLKECLDEIDTFQKGQGSSDVPSMFANDKESYDMCLAMAASCETANDMCLRPVAGVTQRPVARPVQRPVAPAGQGKQPTPLQAPAVQ